MKAVFEEEQTREWNKLNANSVKFRSNDLEELDDMQGIIFFDDNDRKISDAEIYLPPNKAYIVINRVHFGEAGKVFTGDKKEVLKRMINFFLYPGNLKYLASAIWVDLEGSGISEDIAEELGFCPRDSYGNIFRLLNKDFEQFLEHAPAQKEIKDKMLQTYRELRAKNEEHLVDIRKRLERAKEDLKAFINGENEAMIRAKKVEIEHYEAILGIEQKNKGK